MYKNNVHSFTNEYRIYGVDTAIILICLQLSAINLKPGNMHCTRTRQLMHTRWHRHIESPFQFILLCGITSGPNNGKRPMKQTLGFYFFRDHFVYAPSQWKKTLQHNVASHWLGARTNWFLPGISMEMKGLTVTTSPSCPLDITLINYPETATEVLPLKATLSFYDTSQSIYIWVV